MEYIESKTAYKVGWGRSLWRSVRGLTDEEKQLLRDTDNVLWFSFKPFHYTQSGYKVVYRYDRYGFDCREPSADELGHIKNAEGCRNE